jgi:SWIM zinc finger
MVGQFILKHVIYPNSPERLQRAVCGLADATYHVYLTQQDDQHVQGSVINGDQREYAVQIGDGYLSCECPDFGYRKATCKHLLAFALRILQVEEGAQ